MGSKLTLYAGADSARGLLEVFLNGLDTDSSMGPGQCAPGPGGAWLKQEYHRSGNHYVSSVGLVIFIIAFWVQY